MRRRVKQIGILVILALLAVFSLIRIFYLNTVVYEKKEIYTYQAGSRFEYHGFEVEILRSGIYSAEEIKTLYTDIPDDVLDAYDIIVELKLKNCLDQENRFPAEYVTMQDGIEPGGVSNPYMYQYLNQDQGGYVSLRPEEEGTVTLAFPAGRKEFERGSGLKLILAIYPHKYQIEL